mgnify:CR=1 FL=1
MLCVDNHITYYEGICVCVRHTRTHTHTHTLAHGVIYASPIYKGNTIHGFEQGYGKQSSLRTCANLFIYVYKDIV